MAAMVSSGASPFSVLDEDDELQSWQFLDSISADHGSFEGSRTGELLLSNPAAASPSIISQGSWNIVGVSGQPMRPFATPSPVLSQNTHAVSTSPYSGIAGFNSMPAADIGSGSGGMIFDFSNSSIDLPQQSSQRQQQQEQQYVSQALLNEQGQAVSMPPSYMYSPEDIMVANLNAAFDAIPMLPDSAFSVLDAQSQFIHQPSFDIPLSMQQGNSNVQPWDPTGINHDIFLPEQFTPPKHDDSSISLSPRSPSAVAVKREPSNSIGSGSSSSKRNSTHAIHDIPKKSSGIQKQKKKTTTPPLASSPDHRVKDGLFMFCNQTMETFGKASFGEVEQLERSSQKGRKGALSEEVRASALKVRQAGACFCCHIRKVKCDQQRPCKNCVKLCTLVPEAVCWKFSDFTDILFPDFMRDHFKKTEMERFVADNVESFTLNGTETPCIVTLSSGPSFTAKLVVKAKFFTARAITADVMQHWYNFVGENGVELEALRAAPIGLDVAESNGVASGSGSSNPLRNELRRKVEAYMDALVAEPNYVSQVTELMRRKSDIPTTVLGLVQRYAQQAPDTTIVRRALAIYTMHYVMTRHLTMTQQSIVSLLRVNPVSQTGPYMTPRLLNRQIKAIVDEHMRDQVALLFDDFTKRLKQRSRKEWTPCLAAFLVFCLLMEAMEAAADVFAIMENEIQMRQRKPARFMRAYALEANRQIENMPFKQFAFQFHHIYQTHSRDASAKSFNPLYGIDCMNDLAELNPAAMEFVLGLKNLDWQELDWLSIDPILPNGQGEEHPYPRNVEETYVGRLLSKFLLSFERPGYIFASA